MQAPAVLQWPQEAAQVRAALQQGHTIVLCVTQPHGTDRPAARARVRAVLQAALGDWLGCPSPMVVLRSDAGMPVQLAYPACPVSLSISHETGLSLAAIAPHGTVGVDVLRTLSLPDASECLQLAHDYLGPDAAQRLAMQPPTECATAFAYAWTQWEARLKSAELGLREWTSELDHLLGRPSVHVLPLHPPYCGAVAWTRPPSSNE